MMDKYGKFYININSECNCSCRNCLINKEDRIKASISNEAIEDALEQVTRSVNAKIICEVSGGEPTLASNFFDVLELLNRYKIENKIYKIVLLSNGMTCADKNFAYKVSKYIDDVVVTLYDHRAEVHDWFTGMPGSFDKKVAGINHLLEYGVAVHIKTLPMRQNYAQYLDLAKYIVHNWKNQIHVTINGTHYTGDAMTHSDELAVSYTQSVPYMESAADYLIEHGVKFNFFIPLCMIDPKYWRYSSVNYGEIVSNSWSIAPTLGFGPARRLLDEFVNIHPFCKQCVIQKRCKWPWTKYEQLFGFNEIIEAYTRLNIQ